MQLSAKGRYAVTAMFDLARHGGNGPMALSEMSLAGIISLSYLEQLFARLRRSGLVEGVRGPGGGYRLKKVPQKITIAEIYLAIENDVGQTLPPHHLDDVSEELVLWSHLSGSLYRFLESLTLDQFVSGLDLNAVAAERSEESKRMNFLLPPPVDLS